MSETVTDIDEAKVLGYFETVKSTFLLKLLLLRSHVDANMEVLDFRSFKKEHIDELRAVYSDPTLYRSLAARSGALVPNLLEDVATAALIGGWIIFELVIKDLTQKDYSLVPAELTADFNQNAFGLSSREKKDLELFYYIRNSLVHHNGAFYAKNSPISHTFGGLSVESAGKEGQKISLTLPFIWQLLLRLEELTLKAWTSSHLHRKRGMGPVA
jgi:hypothetical protein